MTDKFIPNSFQTPNAYVDKYMAFLTPNEYKVLSYMARRIFGFQKRQDEISLSQLTDGITKHDGERLDYGTGLTKSAVKPAIKGLVEYGFVVICKSYSVELNKATTYSLQYEEKEVDINGLMKRHEQAKIVNRKRTLEARKSKGNGKTAGLGSGTIQAYPVSSDNTGLGSGTDETCVVALPYNNQGKPDQKSLLENLHVNHLPIHNRFIEVTGIKPKKIDQKRWSNTIQDWAIRGCVPDCVNEAVIKAKTSGRKPYPIIGPWSLEKFIANLLMERENVLASPYREATAKDMI